MSRVIARVSHNFIYWYANVILPAPSLVKLSRLERNIFGFVRTLVKAGI